MPTVTCPHCSQGVELPTDGQTYGCPHCRQPLTAPAVALPPQFVYKMVQVPPNIDVAEGESRRGLVANYLQGIVNDHARAGWEFFRVDQLGIRVHPGCLAGLFGARQYTVIYSVITFRRPA